ncbi:MAG: universal stress protein [Gaiellaceae bacterium]
MAGPVMEQLLTATDGSEPAMKALEFAIDLAGWKGAALTLVHVVPNDRVRDDEVYWDDADHEILRAAGDLARDRGVETKLVMCSGSPPEAIAKLAEELNADLVVLGSRGRGRVAGRLLGSVSRGVLERAHRPVLVVQ